MPGFPDTDVSPLGGVYRKEIWCGVINWINQDAMPTSFQPIRLLDPGCWIKFVFPSRMTVRTQHVLSQDQSVLCKPSYMWFMAEFYSLTLILLNLICPVCKQCRFRSSLKPADLDLHYLSFSIWLCVKNLDPVIWLADNYKWTWHLNLFSMTRVKNCRILPNLHFSLMLIHFSLCITRFIITQFWI